MSDDVVVQGFLWDPFGILFEALSIVPSSSSLTIIDGLLILLYLLLLLIYYWAILTVMESKLKDLKSVVFNVFI